jgi:hypothetical protein
MTGGARGEGILEKEKTGRRGAARPAGPKGGARLGRLGGPRRGGGGGGWAAAGPRGKGVKGGLGQKGEEGGREKEKAFLFLISIFSYMPNSSIHSTANKRVHNPA